jgi:hypothetical protein
MPISPGNIVTLNWTNPGLKSAISINPGTTDAASTSLELIGQGAPGWAVPLQENFLKVLENFASTGSPDNPTIGQLWYDTSSAKLFVCTSLSPTWREIISNPDVFVSTSPPDPASVGNLWYQPVTRQLSVCVTATVITPPTIATWSKVLTFESIVSTSQPGFPRIDGQLWYNVTNRILYAWNTGSNAWDQLAPNPEIDVVGGVGWNEVIPWLNKILSTPTNTLDNADPFTENNSWGFNQTTPFAPIYTDVPGTEWIRLYDTVLGLCNLLGVSATGLISQDFHLPGSHSNQYGIPFMLDQWTLIKAKVEELKSNRLNVAGPSLEYSNAIIRFVSPLLNTNAGSIIAATSPSVSGYPQAETWTITATNATNFTVVGSVSGAQAAATVGTPYSNAFISFTINAGINPFVATDYFTITVLPNLKASYTTAWGAGANGIHVFLEYAFNNIAHQRSFFNAGGKIKVSTSFDDTTTNRNTFWNQFLTAVNNITIEKGVTTYGLSPIADPANLGYYDLTSSWQTLCNVDARILPSSAIRSFGYAAPFTATAAVAGGSNIGTGTVGTLSAIDQNPLTTIVETWTLTALDATTFAVVGSTSGGMANATVGVAYTNAHVGFTITAGGTPFVAGDLFTFTTTGVLNYAKLEGRTVNGGNNIQLKLTLNDTGTAAPDSVTTTGANKGTVTQIDFAKANDTFLNNPEVPYPTAVTGVSVSGDTLLTWAP